MINMIILEVYVLSIRYANKPATQATKERNPTEKYSGEKARAPKISKIFCRVVRPKNLGNLRASSP